MTRTGIAIIAGVMALIALLITVAGLTGPWWGVNAFHYLGPAEMAAWSGLAAVGLAVGALYKRTPRTIAQVVSMPAALAGLIVFLLLIALPHAATPLLGDGLDRIEALPAGWKILRGQPAPLDLIIHLIGYRITALAVADSFSASWKSWQWSSCLGGALAAAALWAWAGIRAEDPAEKIMLFLMTLISGTALFFMGYPENYVSLAAAVPVLLLVLELVARRRAPAWSLIVIMTIMVGLHFFAALLIPALLIALHRRRVWTPGRAARVILAGGALVFILISIITVQRHFHGVAKIFTAPGKMFSAYHLAGFLNQQILAAPLLPLFGFLLILAGRFNRSDAVQDFAGLGSLTWLAFFFILRPVIGPGADWDLFALPSLLFTPWLALRVVEGWRGRPERRLAFGAVLAVTAVSVGPWLSVNLRERASVERFRDLMEWEAPHNDYAASFGYYRLGKWLARSGGSDAPAALERAVEINPDSATLRGQVAAVFIAVGDQERARAHMFMHHRIKAKRDAGDGKYEDAAKEYEQALKLRPGDKGTLEELIKLYDGPLGRSDMARHYRALLPP